MRLKIGNTPFIELTKEIRGLALGSRIFAKLENYNAGGSIKDRVALAVIEEAEKLGKLKQGGVAVEATSGNMGIGLALVCKAKGYRAVIIMPENMSKQRQELIRSYGGEVILTDAQKGMRGAVERAKALVQNTPNAYFVDQFNNPACVTAHYQTTAAELWTQARGKIDVFVAGVGTGGTLTGVGRYIKERNPAAIVVAVEPCSSPLLSQGVSGAHAIQGIGANFLPSILDRSVYGEVLTVTDGEAFFWTKRLWKTGGLSVGLSSGAAFSACLRLAKRYAVQGKNIVTIFPDDGNRYALNEKSGGQVCVE